MLDVCHVCGLYQTLQPLSFSTLAYKVTSVNSCTTCHVLEIHGY